MWFKCITALALAALAQTILLADTLDDFEEVPGFQANWTLVFSPSIVYLVFAAITVLSRFWRTIYLTNKSRQASTAMPLDDPPLLDPVARQNAAAVDRRNAWVTFIDTLFDTALLACGIVFVVLMINTLSTAQILLVQDDEDDPQVTTDDYSFVNASIPLVVLWSLLALAALVGAWRTFNEHRRAQRDGVGSAFCCFGGAIEQDEGDNEDGSSTTSISYRAGAIKEKGAYMANANYQQWPCAFMFSWSLGYGWPDSLLSIVLFLMLPAMVLVTLLLARFLDTGAPSVGSAFIVLWILEGIAVLLAVVAALWMCCCAWMPVKQPQGRAGYLAKASELFIVTLAMILLATQQIMIAVPVDNRDATADDPSSSDTAPPASKDPIEWHLVFFPFYALFGLAAFAGCASGFCCVKPSGRRTGAHPCAADYDGDDSGKTLQTSAWGLVGEQK